MHSNHATKPQSCPGRRAASSAASMIGSAERRGTKTPPFRWKRPWKMRWFWWWNFPWWKQGDNWWKAGDFGLKSGQISSWSVGQPGHSEINRRIWRLTWGRL